MSMGTLNEEFRHSWSAEVLRQPPLIAPAQQFVYPQNVPGEEDALARGALYVQVKSAFRGSFLATCALGFSDPSLPSGVWSCPEPDSLLAIAGGYGYLIDTTRPQGCLFLSLRPIAAVLPVPAHDVLVLAGFHHVLAVDANGLRWETTRLSWEGVTLGDVQDGALHGTGWDMFADREVPFTVDIVTGKQEGGGYRR